MIGLLILYLLQFTPITGLSDSFKLQCSEITICRGRYVSLISNHRDIMYKLARQEADIEKLQHWNGFRPFQYNLAMNFQDSTNYTGSVEISGVILQATSSLAVNIDHTYISYSKENVSIVRCSLFKMERPHICIKGVIHDSRLNYTLLSLNDTLLPWDRCVVKFRHFHSFVRRDGKNSSAIGLRISEGKDSMAIITDFGMRYARTVFPCMDHPALKARFNLTIQHPYEFVAVSSTPYKFNTTNVMPANSISSSFRLTDLLSTYMFGFALLKGYKVVTDVRAPSMQLYLPLVENERFRWIAKALYIDIQLSEELPQMPTYPINYVVLNSMPKPSINSYGLVFLDSNSIRNSSENITAKISLYETILRQYLGAIVTVSNWNEVCLQEGLIQYFKLVRGKSLWKRYRKELKAESHLTVCTKYSGRLTGSENETMMDTNSCTKRAGAFFRGLSKTFGQHVIKKLFDNMVSHYRNGAACLKDWDDELANVTDSRPSLSGYLTNYFHQTGPIEVFVSFNEKKVSVDVNVVKAASSNLPFPLKIYMPILTAHVPFVVAYDNIHIHLSKDVPWILVDPEGDTCAVITYDKTTASLITRATYDPYGILNRRWTK